jgi:CheY-like chemotaxis protein
MAKSLTVMIIDDDTEDAMLLSDVIKEVAPNVNCILEHSYVSAKMTLEDMHPPDVIFLDAMMYPIGGKEALKLLTQMAKLSDTRIIINSGAISKAEAEEFSDLGADHVLQKPPDYYAMVSSVKSILTTA